MHRHSNPEPLNRAISMECFHSRDWRPYWSVKTVGNVWIKIELKFYMAVISLFWDTNMAAVTSDENTLWSS